MQKVHEENVKARKAEKLRKLAKKKELKEAPKQNPMWPMGKVTAASFPKKDSSIDNKKRWSVHGAEDLIQESRHQDDDDDDDDQSQHGDMGESSSSSSSAASSTEYDPVQDMMEANGWSKDKLTSGAVKETLPDVGEEEQSQSQSSNAGNSNAHSKTKTASHTTSHSEHQNKKSVGEGSSESDDDEDHDESEHRQHHHRRHHKVLPHKKHVQKHTQQQKKKTINKAKKQHAVHKTQSHHEDLGESDDENEGELSETEAKASTSSDNWPVVNDSPSTSIAIHHKNEQGEDDLLADPSADEVAP